MRNIGRDGRMRNGRGLRGMLVHDLKLPLKMPLHHRFGNARM
jgi:hypothetical protein